MDNITTQINELFTDFKSQLKTKNDEIEKLGHATAETSQIIERMNTKFDELETTSKKRIDELEAKMNRERMLEAKEGKGKSESCKAFGTFLRKQLDLNALDLETKNSVMLSRTSDGSFILPPDFMSDVLNQPYYTSLFMNKVRRIKTDRGEVVFPREVIASGSTAVDKTGAITSANTSLVGTWEGEADATATPGVQLTMGSVRIILKKLRILAQVPIETLTDSNIDVEGYLAERFANVLAFQAEQAIVNGSGGMRPDGILTDASVVANCLVKSGSATALTYAGICNLAYALDPIYFNKASFVCNNATVGALRTITSTTGFPIWAPAVNEFSPSTLLGLPVVVSQAMPSLVASDTATYPLMVGDWNSAYILAEQNDTLVTSQTLRELYMDSDCFGYVVRKRYGGVVALPNSLRVQYLST